MRVTQEQYKKFLNNSINVKQSKYHNKKVIYDGIKFDSKKEMAYYIKLKLLEKSGEIKDLQLQKEYVLQDSFKLNNKTYRKITYKADFEYISTKDDKLHIVDVKGSKSMITEVFKLKQKLFAYKYGIEIEVII